MPTVRFPPHLLRHVAIPPVVEVSGNTVAALLAEIDLRFPGVRDYLVDERGALRKHVNIFIGDALVRDRQSLSDALDGEAQVFVFQALSGG